MAAASEPLVVTAREARTRRGGAASYLADGRAVVWDVPARDHAVDAEIAGAPVPPALARRTGIDDPAVFWPAWTRAEVVAKLTGEPILLLVKRAGLPVDVPDGIEVRTINRDDLVISLGSMAKKPTVGVVMLHMGDRPVELARALETLHAQEGVELDVVLVGNGWQPTGLPDWVRTVHLSENVGIPEGRNVGAAEARGELIYFYDDDASLPTPDVLARLAAVILAESDIAVAQPRGEDPTGKPAPRRWVPRFDVSDGGAAGEATWFWEAVFMIRRSAFEQVGGWPGQFFFAHEGIDLAWRLVDAGWRIIYAPDIVVNHPSTDAARHAVYYRTNARNRVWVARRNLPWPLVPIYLGNWTAITLLRVHDKESLKVWFRGFAEGVRTPAGQRQPMSWKTVARLTRAGRPPVV